MSPHPRPTPRGTVYLIGAGPGDPGLLTLRANRVLRRADAVVYDALVNPALLKRVRPSALLVDAGKRAGAHCMPQQQINAQLVELAQRHRVVARLKGGDPFVFGRGGEEALALSAAGVRFRIVPGVTSGVAAPAYAGIPVTHRGLASAVTLVTGHGDASACSEAVDWAQLARLPGTLVIYMGMGRLRRLADRLLAAGRCAATPAAVIEWGTYPHQRTVTGSLFDIADRAHDAGLGAPAIIVIGEVVRLREQLRWFAASAPAAPLAAPHQLEAVAPA
jgi:uroporphyrin-III C-methyltransferase